MSDATEKEKGSKSPVADGPAETAAPMRTLDDSTPVDLAQAKIYHQSILNAQKNRSSRSPSPTVRPTAIKITFPGQHEVEFELPAKATLQDLKSAVDAMLVDVIPYTLEVAYPREVVLSPSSKLQKSISSFSLGPRVAFKAMPVAGPSGSSGSSQSPTLRLKSDVPLMKRREIAETTVEPPKASSPSPKPNKGSKMVPKWLKLSKK